MKKHLLFFLLSLIFLIQFGQILFFKQANFLTPYDVSYWKDRFEHSQWQLPLSQRTIGDDGLFTYVGYTLARGADPSKINPETGPVGKYLLGWSTILLHNPTWAPFFFSIGSLIAFYFLCKQVVKSSKGAFIATLVLFLDPLFFEQFWSNSVDIFQFFFLLLTFLFLFTKPLHNKHATIFTLLSGISLGLFSGVKLPLLTPVIFLLGILYLFAKKEKQLCIAFTLGTILGFTFPYMQYFFLGYTIKEFLGLQKYIIVFYTKSHLIAHKGAIWDVLFSGKLPNITSTIVEKVPEWWIFWPIVTLFSLLGILQICRKEIFSEKVIIGLYLLFTLIIFSFIPFYARYLLLVLPFFLIFFVKYILQFPKLLQVTTLFICIVVGIQNSFIFLQPKLGPLADYFYYNLSRGYFQDIYQEDIARESKKSMDRSAFRNIGQKAFYDGNITAIHVQEISKKAMGDKEDRKIHITYYTRFLGSFTNEIVVHFVKQNQAWKAIWDWNLVLPGFRPGFIAGTRFISGKRGEIQDSTDILAQDGEGQLVLVDPSQIDRTKENDMLSFFAKLSGAKAVYIQNAYLENPLPHTPIPLFTSWSRWDSTVVQRLKAFPGVFLSPVSSRLYVNFSTKTIENTAYIECCTRIYSSYAYHGISGPEKDFDRLLSGEDGGELFLQDPRNQHIFSLLIKEPKNGQDIQISL